MFAEAKDGYRVAYSIGEIDPATGNAQILVANKKNGDLLSVSEGPYRCVLPRDKHGTRWIRQVTRISLHQFRVEAPAKLPAD